MPTNRPIQSADQLCRDLQSVGDCHHLTIKQQEKYYLANPKKCNEALTKLADVFWRVIQDPKQLPKSVISLQNYCVYQKDKICAKRLNCGFAHSPLLALFIKTIRFPSTKTKPCFNGSECEFKKEIERCAGIHEGDFLVKIPEKLLKPNALSDSNDEEQLDDLDQGRLHKSSPEKISFSSDSMFAVLDPDGLQPDEFSPNSPRDLQEFVEQEGLLTQPQTPVLSHIPFTPKKPPALAMELHPFQEASLMRGFDSGAELFLQQRISKEALMKEIFPNRPSEASPKLTPYFDAPVEECDLLALESTPEEVAASPAQERRLVPFFKKERLPLTEGDREINDFNKGRERLVDQVERFKRNPDKAYRKVDYLKTLYQQNPELIEKKRQLEMCNYEERCNRIFCHFAHSPEICIASWEVSTRKPIDTILSRGTMPNGLGPHANDLPTRSGASFRAVFRSFPQIRPNLNRDPAQGERSQIGSSQKRAV